MIPVSKTLETDIAVVGGGIGGLCAAIAAAEGGARVMVLEKANTKRSGSGATGNDHFACYYPKHHGGDIRPILRELLDSLVGLCHDPLLSLRFLERSISIVDKWHEWGINMKPFAEDYVFMGHAYPDRPRIWLKYDGHNQKEALTRPDAVAFLINLKNSHTLSQKIYFQIIMPVDRDSLSLKRPQIIMAYRHGKCLCSMF